MTDHQPHIVPSRRDVEMAELEADLAICRRLLREAVLRDGLVDERWFREAALAAGGDDE